MNGVNAVGLSRGLPATAVVRLTGSKPMAAARARNAEAEAALLAAVEFPPRVGEIRPIAALLPQVLARYGLAEGPGEDQGAVADDLRSIDCFA